MARKAKRSAIDPLGSYFVRITVSGRNLDDVDDWSKSLTAFTNNIIVPYNSVMGIEDKQERDAGYDISEREGRTVLRFILGVSAGPNHSIFSNSSQAELSAKRIVETEAYDDRGNSSGSAFLMPLKIDAWETMLHTFRAQKWWTFGSEKKPVKPIVTYIASNAAGTDEWFDYALSDPGLFGAEKGPQLLTQEQFAAIQLEPYGLEHLGPDFRKYAAPLIEEEIKRLEDDGTTVVDRPFRRVDLETSKLPVRLRPDFISKLIEGYENLLDDKGKLNVEGKKVARDPEQARPWEYFVRDPERYPEDQGRMYWDVLGLPRGRDSKESTDPVKYRKVRTAWTNSTEYGKQYHLQWNRGESNKRVQNLYDTSTKGRERKQAYKDSEGGKEASKLYQKRKRVRDKIYRTLFQEIHPITNETWTELQVDYYIWDNYGDHLLREQWLKGEDFFLYGPDAQKKVGRSSMLGKWGAHTRPSKISPESLDYHDGYTNPEIKVEE